MVTAAVNRYMEKGDYTEKKRTRGSRLAPGGFSIITVDVRKVPARWPADRSISNAPAKGRYSSIRPWLELFIPSRNGRTY